MQARKLGMAVEAVRLETNGEDARVVLCWPGSGFKRAWQQIIRAWQKETHARRVTLLAMTCISTTYPLGAAHCQRFVSRVESRGRRSIVLVQEWRRNDELW